MQSTIWITGAAGTLGKKIVRRLSKNTSYKIIGTDTDVDISDARAVSAFAEICKPNVIINCAAVSDAAYCEEHEVEAYRVNAIGARNMASISMQLGAKIIHMSTDDVFSGIHMRSKTEFDIPTPDTVYGKSKLAGEVFVRDLNTKHFIIRTSWMYSTNGNDYVNYVLDKGRKGESFNSSLNRISSPTSMKRLIDFIEILLETNEYGIYHASCEGACSRHEFARAILSMAGFDPDLAVGNYASANNKTVSTLLDNMMMKITGIYQMPQWREELAERIKKMI